MGITVSGRVGHAVVRNRARRRVREALRMRLSRLPVGRDLVVVARPAIAQASWPEVSAALDRALQRAGLVPRATAAIDACV